MSGAKRTKRSEETEKPAKQSASGKWNSTQLYLIITVVNDGQGTAIVRIMEKCGASTSFGCHGQDGVSNDLYDMFGLQNDVKQVVFTPLTDYAWPLVKKSLMTRFSVSAVARGMAFAISIGSMIGTNAYRFVANERVGIKENEGGDSVDDLKKNDKYEVIFTIVNDGYMDLVMETAKKAGAKGGTVINARGTGNKDIEKFFGISITPEKQIVMILVPKTIKDQVLTAIYQAAGLSSKGQGIAFSIPATDVVGLVETDQIEPANSEEK